MSLRRYILVYIATLFVLMVISFVIEKTLAIDITNAGMAIIPAMCAGMLEGQKYARRERKLPEVSDMWRFSRQVGLVSLVLTLVPVVLLSFILPDLRQVMQQPMGTVIVMGGVVLQAVLALLVTRWFLSTGAKSELAGQKKSAASAADKETRSSRK